MGRSSPLREDADRARGRSSRAPGRAHTSRRDQAALSARRTPSGRDGCRPRSRSPRIGATPDRAPSSPPAGGAGSAGGAPPPARSRARRRPGDGRGRVVRGASRRRRPARSTRPLILHRTFADGQPASPPRRSTSANTRSGGAATTRPRRSTIIPSRDGDRREGRPIRRGERVEPGRLDVVAVDSIDRSRERLDVGERVEAERGGRAGIPDDDLVAKALDERPGDACRHRGDRGSPSRSESRGVSTGTGIIRRRRPRRRAYARIMSPYERMSGPPTSTTPVTSGWSSAPTR